MAGKIRVLIVDDSSLMREALKSILSQDPLLEVVGVAKDGKEGTEKALLLKPDVVTMDLKMPIMTGLEAIEQIMRERPTPIIVVSSMDVKVIVKALTIGAMDFVAVTQEVDQIAQDLISKIKISAKVKPLRRITIRPVKKTQSLKQKEAFKIVAVGASTGGPQALQLLLSKLPKDFSAGILVVQHISQGFINGLTEWLRATSPLDITLAKTGDTVKTGTVYFAPDDFHMKIDNNGVISLTEDMSHKSFHVPSIDETMKSLAAAYKDNAVGVIMTGMGHDGAEGMCQIQQAGGATIAQDEKSSMIFGMNKTAIEKGCIDKIVPLERIAAELIKLTK